MADDHFFHALNKIIHLKLSRADVDRQRQVMHLLISRPLCKLLTGGLDHPMPNIENQPALFRNRNELNRRNHSALGMHPADQRLRSDRAMVTIHLYLVIQLQLTVW